MVTSYLHVGYPKTGTTALQEGFDAQRSVLSEHRVLYPEVGLFQSRHANLAWSCMTLGKWAASKYSGESTADLMAAVGAQLPGHDAVIISSEDFSYQRPERYAGVVSALASWGEVVVVAYLRPQVEAIESMYRQVVRNRGYAKPFDAFVDETLQESVGASPYGGDGAGWGGSLPPYDYSVFLDAWAEAVPGGRVVAAEYGNEAKAGIVEHFFSTIGIPVPDGLTTGSRSNVSIGGGYLEILRRANDYLPPGMRRRLSLDIAAVAGEMPISRTELADLQQIERIGEAFAESNARVESEYMTGGPGRP